MRRFFLNAAACIARCQCVCICICSRTDIKISSFHEDSRNKDCKKVWNEPRALPRAHISRLFPFSFSVARPFLFCSLHLSVILTLQGCRGGGSLWIFSFAPAMKWWTTPPFAVTPPRRATRAFCRRFPTEKKSLTLGFLPRFLHANHTIGSLNFRASVGTTLGLIYQNQPAAIGNWRNCSKTLRVR